MRLNNPALFALGLIIIGTMCSGANGAPITTSYLFSGTVLGVTKDAFTVKDGSEIREFRKGPGLPASVSRVKAGDHVTVHYYLRVEDITIEPGNVREKQRQEPGQRPGQQPGLPGVPGTIDDRAFYES